MKPDASVTQKYPRDLLTRWDVSSNPGKWEFFILKKKEKKPNKWGTVKSLVHNIRLDGGRGKRDG